MSQILYMTILTVLWVGIWSGCFWCLRARRQGRFFWRRPGSAWIITGVSLLIPMLYGMSYFPFLRLRSAMPNLEPLEDLYIPMQWLFDHTPVRDLVLRMADVCGVSRTILIEASSARMSGFWGSTPPWQYATGWALLGIATCFLPPFILEWSVAGTAHRRTQNLLNT